MDWKTFTVELVKSGMWPIIVLVVALMVRRPITSLLDGLKLKSMKGGGFEAEFQMLSAEVKREVSALPTAPPQAALPLKAAKALPGKDARGAVMSAWLEVEQAILDAADRAEVTAEGFPEKLRALGAKGLLQPSTIDAVTGLRMMRNMAAHTPEPISEDKAKDFVAMADAVVFAISVNLKKR